MIDREHDLPLVRQAELLRLSRSTLYYEPRPVSTAELAVMRRVDALHLEYPFAGSRMLRDLLRGEGIERWLVKFGQVDKWSFCLRAARMPRIRSNHDETIPPDPRTGIQGQSGPSTTWAVILISLMISVACVCAT